MKSSWERTEDGRTYYASVSATRVVVGQHDGSGHTDSAGSCTLHEFLQGRFADVVSRDFGEQVLAEAIASARFKLSQQDKG